MVPHHEDAYLNTQTLPSQRFLFGGDIELEAWENERWANFQSWIAEKGLKPLSDVFTSESRLGFQLMYFYGFDKPGAPDVEIFHDAYNNLKTIEDHYFPSDPEKLRKYIDTGAIRVIGRVTELGHQPILDINVNKFIKEIAKKMKAST